MTNEYNPTRRSMLNGVHWVVLSVTSPSGMIIAESGLETSAQHHGSFRYQWMGGNSAKTPRRHKNTLCVQGIHLVTTIESSCSYDQFIRHHYYL